MSSEGVTPLQQPPKYSRYRSVRKAASTQNANPSAPTEKNDERHESIQRSMSRYRRPRTSHNSVGNAPPIPGLPQQLAHGGNSRDRGDSNGLRNDTMGSGHSSAESPRDTVGSLSYGQGDIRRESGQWLQQSNAIDLRPPDASRDTLEERERKLAEQKKKDLERLEKELDAAVKSPTFSTGPISPRDKLEKFKIFKRDKDETQPVPVPAPAPVLSPPPESSPVSEVKSNDIPIGVPLSSGSVVPGFDAPKSAVNAGERRVLIRCKQSSINLPVLPATSASDLIYSAANVLSQSVSPSAAVLVESYTKLGLERRIRRYEFIRDIMNSWDRDTQNALLLQPSDSPGHDLDLDPYHVPKEAPKDITVYMHHSQKPGKWNKRYVTLLSTGQIFISKKAGAASTNKDVTNICHLSDFDIYTPSTQQVRKNLKLPKKYCHAIKSQQKTTIFLSTENYVHFFSTDDENLANKWYDAVQAWRSWYLFNKKGTGIKRSSTKPSAKSSQASRPKTAANPVNRQSVDQPYLLGSFKPLGLDTDQFNRLSLEDQDEEDDENRPRQIPFHLRNTLPSPPPMELSRAESRRHPPPVTYGRRNLPASDYQGDYPDDGGPTFAPTGLLGNVYNIRQQAQRDREIQGHDEGPFVAGPSLLNNASTTPASAGASARPRTSIDTGQGHNPRRSLSVRPTTRGRDAPNASATAGGATLLDLSSKFGDVGTAAPHWRGEGKGHGVVAPSGVPLVEAAGGGEGRLRGRSGTVKVEEGGAFVKGGLLTGGGG